jgi:hypothetical protein
MSNRYRVVEREGKPSILLRDDGYRIRGRYLPDGDTDEIPSGEFLIAEYKQCDFPDMAQALADLVMKP